MGLLCKGFCREIRLKIISRLEILEIIQNVTTITLSQYTSQIVDLK